MSTMGPGTPAEGRPPKRPGRPRPASRRGRGRVILVSNRLPVSVRLEDGELVVDRSSGGLATGLGAWHEHHDSTWIGWPGETWRLSQPQRADLRARLDSLRAVPVELDAGDIEGYYDGFANGILWPLLHYELDRLPAEIEGWETYRAVNRIFAEAVVREYRPGDLVWIHDYHLMLVPEMVRRQLPGAAIGFFSHVPFPSSELFRLLPSRRELLEGILGASLVGFHTESYAGHFISSAARILGCETRPGRVIIDNRRVRVGAFPMGIDAASYETLGESPGIVRRGSAAPPVAAGAALIVAVDRIDYTKGIPRRLMAFERLLESYPDLRGHVRLVQVAAPSRQSVGEYEQVRRSVDGLVGRINGRFSTPAYTPIQYVSQTLSSTRLAALYRAASVALITPLRDGMNLVAKEFVATRTDGDGVLVLSEFAGAASELAGALLVNPYDLDAVAATIRHALDLPKADRRARMNALRERVGTHDVHRWAREFTTALRVEARRQARSADAGTVPADLPSDVVNALLERADGPIALLLDYDGTLVGLRPVPWEAGPDEDLLRALGALAGLPNVAVHVVSGRRREELQLWLGTLPIGLHAEHGLWSRDAAEGSWRSRNRARPAWLGDVRRALAARAAAVPGTFLEEKEASLAWHYRTLPFAVGTREASIVRRQLAGLLEGTSAVILDGHRVIEVRDAGIDKGLVADEVAQATPSPTLLVDR